MILLIVLLAAAGYYLATLAQNGGQSDLADTTSADFPTSTFIPSPDSGMFTAGTPSPLQDMSSGGAQIMSTPSNTPSNPGPGSSNFPAVPDFAPANYEANGGSSTVLAMAGHVATQYGLDPAWFQSLVYQESGGNPNAVSPTGAYGATQIEPGTLSALGYSPSDVQGSTYDQLTAGAQYLAQQLQNFGGDKTLATAAYNAGPGAVQQYGNTVPPYTETQNYVASIKALYTNKFNGGAW